MNTHPIRTMILLLSVIALLAACTQTPGPGPGPDQIPDEEPGTPGTGTPATPSTPSLAGPSGLKKFNSVKELREFLQQSVMAGAMGGFGGAALMRGGLAGDMMMEAAPASAPSAAGKAMDGGGAGDFSTTNVQVAGIDEADFVKNDGQYIYQLVQEKLVIVKAYPAADMAIISQTPIDGMPTNLFLEGTRLVVFTTVNEETERVNRYDYYPQPTYVQVVKALVYDVSDRTKPQLEDTLSIEGNYENARMLDGYVYLVTQQWVGGYYEVEPPIVMMNERIIRPDIFYPPTPQSSYNFHTITAFAPGEDTVNSKTLLLGWGTTLYMSDKNMYLAYRKELPWNYYQQEQDKRFYEAVLPLLPADIQGKANGLKGEFKDPEERWQHLSDLLQTMYDSLSAFERSALSGKIREALDEYDAKLASARDMTVIHRIAIDKGQIEPKSQGEVAGSLHNQWALDEHEGHLRVATTRNIWTARQNIQDNNVFVLNADLKVVGALDGLAKDESIYSTRFLGDRLYMVTFRRIDPLFVIDLGNPEAPKVLGQLKIPGFSDYLHPYDETHLIGIGKETKENEWGGVSIKGLKVALFDVSNVEKPTQVDTLEIGSPGTDSEALSDHRAFLFDKKRGVMVLPVREVTERFNPDRRPWEYYTQRIWQGAYVFSVTDKGIDVAGKIAHFEGDESTQWYWGSPYAVRRSLYMDDVLYTLSNKLIMANSLDDLAELNSVKLPYKVDYYPVPYYRKGGMEETVVAESGVGVATPAVAAPPPSMESAPTE